MFCNRRIWPLVIVFSLVWLPALAQAQLRFMPNPQDTVLVLSNKTAGEDTVLRQAAGRWREQPDNLNTSLEYARAAFMAGMAEGDLRWFGAAKTALNPWWAQAKLPAEGFFLRALVKQGFHDFDGALLDLEKAVAVDNTRLEFLGWQVAIYLVKAEMDKARQACTQIRQRFGATEGDACSAQLQYRTGGAAGAVKVLDALAAHPAFQGPNARDWLAFHRGEARRVGGNAADAIGIWRLHLQSFPRNHVLRLALVELLNQEGRFQEAWSLNLQGPRSDALLVQAIISSRGMGQASAPLLTAEFKQRLEFQRQRGDELIERPHLVFLLRVEQQPEQALTLALKSWQTQREPADAILLAEAALSAGKPAAAAAVYDWQKATGYQEPALEKLLAQLAKKNGKAR